MPAIGRVSKADDGSFKGQTKTLSIRTEITILPNEGKTSDAQADYPVIAGDVGVGAGWNRRSEASGRDYIPVACGP